MNGANYRPQVVWKKKKQSSYMAVSVTCRENKVIEIRLAQEERPKQVILFSYILHNKCNKQDKEDLVSCLVSVKVTHLLQNSPAN